LAKLITYVILKERLFENGTSKDKEIGWGMIDRRILRCGGANWIQLPEVCVEWQAAVLKTFIARQLVSSSFLGSTAQLRPWPPPQNSAEFLGGFSTFFFFTG
jgi:hypothetical protein